MIRFTDTLNAPILLGLFLYSVFGSLLWLASTAANSSTSDGGVGPERTSPALQGLGCLVGLANLLPFAFIAFFGFKVSWIGAGVLFVVLLVATSLQKMLAEILSSVLVSVDARAVVGLIGMVASAYLVLDGMKKLSTENDRPIGQSWPAEAKSAYVQQCARDVSAQTSSNALPFCVCVADSLEAEFGLRDYQEMMAAQPDARGSRVERRLARVLSSCAPRR